MSRTFKFGELLTVVIDGEELTVQFESYAGADQIFVRLHVDSEVSYLSIPLSAVVV